MKLEPPGRGQAGRMALPEAGGRVVVRARHHDTHRSKIFSGLVTTAPDEPVRAEGDHSIQLTLTVLGDDACDYLEAGDTFALWRGHDIGQGVIARRLVLWTD